MDESKPALSLVPSDVHGSLCAQAATREVVWRELIDRVRSGEQSAFAALYDESSPLVYGLTVRILGNKADAEEVTLDVYKQIWRTAKDYDPARASVQAWIVMLARTRAIDRQRQATSRMRVEQPMEDTTRLRTPHPGPEEQTAASEAARRLRVALAALANEQREAIELAFYSGLSHSELSARLGAPLGTVKTRIRQGMLKLRRELGDTELGALA
jgi:RNA polymerase sigma-70 factor, ECF subfamily